MKRFLALILAILMVVGTLVSCSNSEDNSAPDNDKAQNQENEKGEEDEPNKENEKGEENKPNKENENGTSDNTGGDKCTHIDEAKDHACDKCGANMGTHSDSVNDGNHTCDYGCGAILTSCNDSDKDHNCDECGSTTTHNYENGYCTVWERKRVDLHPQWK